MFEQFFSFISFYINLERDCHFAIVTLASKAEIIE